jgi:hypothetical protein
MELVKNQQSLKLELKQLASELRDDKVTIKTIQKEQGSGAASTLQYGLLKKQRHCRHKHIAYSMMRGRSYEQIEPKCREGNEPDQNLIQEILRAYKTADVCIGS